MKFILSLVLFIFVGFSSLWAQQAPHCGTSMESLNQLSEQMLQLKQQHPELWEQAQLRGGVRYVPLTVHLVATSGSSGRVSAVKAIETLCVVNNFYDTSGTDIQFWIKRFNYINSDAAYNQPITFAGHLQYVLNKFEDSGNLFLVGNIPEEPGGNITGYYDTQSDWVVVEKAVVKPEAWETMGHELGHFLSLLHTFNGWECGSFLGPGNAPIISSCGNLPSERLDGSNCTVSGDFMCDTPPDYGFSNGVCVFNQTVLDPSGNLIPVNKENIMTYFFFCPYRQFSPDQITAMNLNLNSPAREYLNLSPVPGGLSPVTESVTLQMPENESYTGIEDANGNAGIYFDWADVPNATHYAIDIARNFAFDIDTYSFVVENNSSAMITDYQFLLDKKYYWRVNAFNGKYLCSETSDIYNFTTDNSVPTMATIKANQWLIYPNPIEAGGHLVVKNGSNIAANTHISLVSMLGQVVAEKTVAFDAQHASDVISTTTVPSGHYILNIKSENGIWQQKVQVI